MERVVESIRVPCPNAAYGCTARLTYYDGTTGAAIAGHVCTRGTAASAIVAALSARRERCWIT